MSEKVEIWARPLRDDLLSVVRGFRNGVVYGAKVRAPHALVMTMLFRGGTLASKLRGIVRATYLHSRNLGTFVALYKAACVVVRRARQADDGWTSFVAGAAAAYVVWGDENPVNSQINMYILSRIVWGAARHAVRSEWVSPVPHSYPLYAAVCWGLVMTLFTQYAPGGGKGGGGGGGKGGGGSKGVLQPSLIASMTYLYSDSEKWPKDASNVIDWFMRE